MKYDSHFTFKRIQIKSIEKAKLFAELFGKMEQEFWIRVCKITLEDCFICPDIDLDLLDKTASERDIQEVLKQLQ